MSLNITNFNAGSIKDLAGSTLSNSSLANKLNIQGGDSNLRQFYNRMGQNATHFADKSVYKLAKKHYFDVEFNFKPSNASVVESILKSSLVETDINNLKYLIQGIDIPDIMTHSPVTRIVTEVGVGSLPGVVTIPSEEMFMIHFLSTEFSLHEHALYYWLNETTSDKWNYKERPFTKCDITVRLLDQKRGDQIFGYKLYNAYPTKIETVNVKHELDTTLTRSVSFLFDTMSVISSPTIVSDVLDDVFDKYVGDKISGKVKRGMADVTDSLPSFM